MADVREAGKSNDRRDMLHVVAYSGPTPTAEHARVRVASASGGKVQETELNELPPAA